MKSEINGTSTEKRLLVITYYWPPLGGSGVQRWLKFVKYMPQFGVTPFVFTPENPAFDIRDDSLLKDVPVEAEVIRFPIWEPYQAFSKVTGIFGGKGKTSVISSRSQKTSPFQKMTTWLRGNLMVPDPRVFWVRSSVRFLSEFIKDNNIQTIITTGPPHSVHLIGYQLRKKNKALRWLADFRDPWSEWGLLDSLMVGGVARKLHQSLERKVLTTADIVTTITPFYVRSFEKLAERKVHLLTNGYDEPDFTELSPVRTNRFVIRHVGIVNEKCNPRPFLLAVKQLCLENTRFSNLVSVDFVGQVHPELREFVLADNTLREVVSFTAAVPHKKLVELYNESCVLLLVLEGYKDAEGYMPGKLFEYIATGLPILGAGPENGDADILMKSSSAGKMVDGSNTAKLKDVLLDYYERWEEGYVVATDRSGIEAYSRKNLTRKLLYEILNGGEW